MESGKGEMVEKDIKTELRDMVEDLKKQILEGNYNLEDVIDIYIEKPVNGDYIAGFSMLLVYGNPFIEFIYHRGEAKIVGHWGGISYETNIDTDTAEYIAEQLEELENS